MRQPMQPRTWPLALALLSGAGLALCALAQAPQPDTAEVDAAYRALDEKTLDLVEVYLKTDCELGEEGLALRAVLEVAQRVTPYLKAVVAQGPPSPVRSDLEAALKTSWEARQRFLDTPEARELGEESFQMMRSITREDYVRLQRESLDAKYRERAALALEKIAGG